MASRIPYPVLGLALALGLVNCSSSSEDTGPAKVQAFVTPRLQGTFVSKDKISDGTWRSCMDAMQAAGLSSVVINHAADADLGTTRYPTAMEGYTMVYPTISLAFPNANQTNIDLYLGLSASEGWWGNSTDPEWLATQADRSNQVADELWSLYKAEPRFRGWYLPYEVDNQTFEDPATWDTLATFYKTMADHLHALDATRPVMIAPFFNPSGGLDAAGWREMWAHVLAIAPIDIIALQDGVGAGNTTVDDLPDWFAATRGAIADAGSACLLWSDTETYNIADWTPMAVNGLVADMKAVSPYVSNMLSWSFADYMDPQLVNPFYYETYRQYATTGALDTEAPTAPASLKVTLEDASTVALTFPISQDNIGIVGYDVMRNDTVVRSASVKGIYVDSGLEASTDYTYSVAAVDGAGNVSQYSPAQTITTPVDPIYLTNLALGKTYTASSEPDPGYPDTDGKELTDGIHGSTTDFLDPAWQGRLDAGTTWIVDLGAVYTIQEVNSTWLYYGDAGITLPSSLTYATSLDGETYTTAGKVLQGIVAGDTGSKTFKLKRMAVEGRYVKVMAATMEGSWSFIDEIEVRQ